MTFTQTYEQILRERTPNLFRLYLNPHVAKTCLALERLIQSAWPPNARSVGQAGSLPYVAQAASLCETFPSFLANSFDEALSGAIKLARYAAAAAGKPTAGLVIDPANRLGPFAATLSHGTKVEFLPGVEVVSSFAARPRNTAFGFVVWTFLDAMEHAEEAMEAFLRVLCIDRESLAQARKLAQDKATPAPDIVVFDESFVNRDVPFAAFAARKALFDHWHTPSKSTFHSTTFQPNSISTLHFMRCLEHADPAFHAEIAVDLHRIDSDLVYRKDLFRRLYSPALAKVIGMTGFETDDVRASGVFVTVNGRDVLDAVGGVACSVRGHNPLDYAAEMASLPDVNVEAELSRRLRDLTELEHVLPAVSGAGAVENALKLALAAQHPRRHVLALKSGFGGKTLLALTGTWNAAYKENVAPLHTDVSYVDPFAVDAIAQINTLLEKTPPAVVQMELIQGVGGVRAVPEAVVRHLDAQRGKHGYLLLIDEVQTGTYRTGPFRLSAALGITPDLLIVGKAVSDMMFPFALTMYSAKVARLLTDAGSTLPAEIRRRYGYEWGYKTALNVLRFAATTGLSEQVAASGKLVERLLRHELASCKAVRDVRVFGLLIGIELDGSRWLQRWFKKRLYQFYLSAMLRHPRFPVLVGFCQYEPNVLKITPPLTTSPDDLRRMCATIGETLRRPFHRLLASTLGKLMLRFAFGVKS